MHLWIISYILILKTGLYMYIYVYIIHTHMHVYILFNHEINIRYINILWFNKLNPIIIDLK
jgi:hypothetical protein